MAMVATEVARGDMRGEIPGRRGGLVVIPMGNEMAVARVTGGEEGSKRESKRESGR